MLEKDKRKPFNVVLRFGSGISSTASEDEIKTTECSDGENFSLALDDSAFKPRKPFVLATTATNGERINGYAQLYRRDGTISTLIQAGDTVYEWDGSTLTSVGTVSTNARLTGSLEANWTLDDRVLITDLGQEEPILQWDGTNLDTMKTGFSNTAVYARYCFVDNDRAWFANMKAGTDVPHMLVGSKRENHEVLSVSDRPSSAISTADPFYMTAPDLKPINGFVPAFGKVMFSTRLGSVFYVAGSTSQDFNILPFYSGSGATGSEGVVNVGNDIFYSKQGAIETLSGLEEFGNVAVDDITRYISEEVRDVESFRLLYNRDNQRVYCWPRDSDKLYVLHKPILDDVLKRVTIKETDQYRSPWMRWTTTHSATFLPTRTWTMIDPATGKMAAYFGTNDGKVYQLESDTYAGDGGDTDVKATRTSALIPSPPGQAFDVNGWILYRKPVDGCTVTLDFLWGGVVEHDQSITVTIPDATGYPVFGGAYYFGGSSYFGVQFKGRIKRQEWSAAGRASSFQVRATVEGVEDFGIIEIGINFEG